MIAISLQSGSNGNCIYVETNGVNLLFDAGISGIEAERRLAALGRNIEQIDALIISHDHADHIRYAGVYQRKYGLPIYITPRTLYKAEKEKMLGKLYDVVYYLPGGQIPFGDVSVRTIPTPHDAIDGVAFVVSSGRKKLGILTDLGHPFKELISVVSSLDAVFIESNFDHGMLESGPYPSFLKKRIKGPGGHLSNRDAANLLQAGTNLKWACLAHLSEKNNSPSVALRTHIEIANPNLTFYTAHRYRSTDLLIV
ncbi:MAG TPA: MBL fold metallo-hydrolase [Nitrospiraceae bacterium]|jgi:phosphoribosyl 1,2-cyclic phosphodiesterase|nr:MBL fold metallo-hydrolase [Nitrospiraceae bacterium]